MDWKKTGRKLLFPPVWLILLLTILSTVVLPTVFVNNWEQHVIAYFVFVLAFYTLTVVTVFCVRKLPKQLVQLKARIYANPFGNHYLTDDAFHARVSLYVSLGISLMYVAINLFSWHISRSWWFVILAVYDVIMAVMRSLLAGYLRINKIGGSILGEWKRARICAYILLLVNLSLSGSVLMILYQNRGFEYPGIMIYVMALYTFYSATHAILENIRYRAMESPVLSTAKIVSLSAALVSMLNLETAMFAQFGADMAQQDQNLMIILTGAGISVMVVTLSVLLIAKATNVIRREKHGS